MRRAAQATRQDAIGSVQAELRGTGLRDPDAQLRKASGFAFYNTSRYDFDKLLADAPHVANNLRNFIADIRAIEGDIVRMLAEVTGGQAAG